MWTDVILIDPCGKMFNTTDRHQIILRAIARLERAGLREPGGAFTTAAMKEIIDIDRSCRTMK